MLYFVSRDQHVIERVRLNGDDRRIVLARITPTDLVAVQFPSSEVNILNIFLKESFTENFQC